jgi:hypothetical protein
MPPLQPFPIGTPVTLNAAALRLEGGDHAKVPLIGRPGSIVSRVYAVTKLEPETERTIYNVRFEVAIGQQTLRVYRYKLLPQVSDDDNVPLD